MAKTAAQKKPEAKPLSPAEAAKAAQEQQRAAAAADEERRAEHKAAEADARQAEKARADAQAAIVAEAQAEALAHAEQQIGRTVVFTTLDGRKRAAAVTLADAKGFGLSVLWHDEDKLSRRVPARVQYDESGRPNTFRFAPNTAVGGGALSDRAIAQLHSRLDALTDSLRGQGARIGESLSAIENAVAAPLAAMEARLSEMERSAGALLGKNMADAQSKAAEPAPEPAKKSK
ncbi:MAG: hypothetical protein KC503_17345 [Myxococcales bacterium]|nr:hypothetical protein [Myxococcales bacterium]